MNFRIAASTHDSDNGGNTKYTALIRHWTVAGREAHEETGFHQGWAICAGQLAAIVEILYDAGQPGGSL
jgi:uncharacterized protein YndB with AHSA1/START domain